MRRYSGWSHREDERSVAFRSGGRGGFTLVEVLMVVALIAILAATVIAEFHRMLGMGRSEAMSATVTHIRQIIELKAAKREGDLAASGFPADIEPAWFQMGHLPYHTWTDDPMIVETVSAGADQIYPAVKTFDDQAPGAENAWYNTTNGAFCVRVGYTGDDAQDLESFNTANSARATTMDQTTE
jgi:prepilin-type N-terminal cleavage/methylation domain-containing protein